MQNFDPWIKSLLYIDHTKKFDSCSILQFPNLKLSNDKLHDLYKQSYPFSTEKIIKQNFVFTITLKQKLFYVFAHFLPRSVEEQSELFNGLLILDKEKDLKEENQEKENEKEKDLKEEKQEKEDKENKQGVQEKIELKKGAQFEIQNSTKPHSVLGDSILIISQHPFYYFFSSVLEKISAPLMKDKAQLNEFYKMIKSCWPKQLKMNEKSEQFKCLLNEMVNENEIENENENEEKVAKITPDIEPSTDTENENDKEQEQKEEEIENENENENETENGTETKLEEIPSSIINNFENKEKEKEKDKENNKEKEKQKESEGVSTGIEQFTEQSTEVSSESSTESDNNIALEMKVFVPGNYKSLWENKTNPLICMPNHPGVDFDLYKIFHRVLPSLWNCWQILITSEPLIVISPTPKLASKIVLAIQSLISPLIFKGKVYPFVSNDSLQSQFIKSLDFTPKEDLDNKQIDPQKEKKKGIIFGSTDYSLRKGLCKYWPNFLFVGLPNNEEQKKLPKKKRIKEKLQMASYPMVSIDRKVLGQFKIRRRKKKQKENSLYKSQLIRSYFYQLTENFMVPFETYFTFLTPKIQNIDPIYQPPVVKGFNENEFIQLLGASKLGRDFNGKFTEPEEVLYRKFIQSRTFRSWYRIKKLSVRGILKKLYRSSYFHMDIASKTKDKTDIEKIDLVMRLIDAANKATKSKDIDLKKHIIDFIKTVIRNISKEYQSILNHKIKSLEIDSKELLLINKK
ncbi:hypothetical protein M0812_03035 [Anaeramoeba flamelloides]|uniref:UDENN domain-containing protein n=1 Tax=Anaeramoeba flamelloides TaxID=1746091 RepID=A0AAV7YNS6_9EUKA|nr:hypothetical protein M0812_03035 [Anaeramoeba flamelloides]